MLTNSQPSGTGCTISYNNGNAFTFTGTWAPDPPNFPSNTSPIWQSGGSGTSYHWACLAASAFSTPADNTQFGAFKEADDDRTDGTFRYFTNLPWHGSAANPGNSGVFRSGGNTINAGTKAFFYTSTGIYICTWAANPGGSNNHWNTNASHSGGEGTQYTQRCA